jgi:hypothetical protein
MAPLSRSKQATNLTAVENMRMFVIAQKPTITQNHIVSEAVSFSHSPTSTHTVKLLRTKMDPAVRIPE